MSYIVVTPALMQVPCQGGFTAHTLECFGTERLCFRVRLKKKYYELYKVNPPMGFLRPGQKKQLILERRPGKPGKTFLLVEYIAAPRGYDPRTPFVEGAEVGRVKIRVRAYKDQKIADTVPNLTGQKVTRRGQKFKAPEVVDDEKIEREIAELFAKKDAPLPVFEFDDHGLGDEEDDETVDKKKTEEKKSERRAKLPSSPNEKKQVVAVNAPGGANAELELKLSNLVENIKVRIDELSRQSATLMRSADERDRKLDKLDGDLSFIRTLLMVLLVLVPVCALLFRQ